MKRAFVLLMLCGSAQAEFWTGNQLLSKMTGDTNAQLLAIGYVTGAADAMTGTRYCPPVGVTVGQVYDMTKRLLESAPGQRHQSGDMFVAAAMSDWPCKQQSRGNPI
jgi:hypothetical protein